jgi:hypothetical protein
MIPSLFHRIPKDTSQFGEQKIICDILKELSINVYSQFIIDIGAGDGVEGSNTYHWFREGASGLAVEPVSNRFQNLAINHAGFDTVLYRGYATPDNIQFILKSAQTPHDPLFMSIDIDSYDYYVLQEILKYCRPSLVCCEINENMPPPIKFAVTPNTTCSYTTGSHFYGMSISALAELCEEFDYDIVCLNYVNAFIVPHDINKMKVLTAEDAYNSGYRDKPDRKKKFPWNSDMETVLYSEPERGVEILNAMFIQESGNYILDIGSESIKEKLK